MLHVESLETRALLSSTPVAVTTLLAQAKTIAADDRSVLSADAAGIKAVTAAIRAAKLTGTDSAQLKALTDANAADLRAFATSIKLVKLAVSTDTRKLAAADAALAKKPSAKRLALVSSLSSKLATDASTAISALTTADAKLAFDDSGASSNLPDVVSSASQVFDGGFEVPGTGAGDLYDGVPGSGSLLYFASGTDSYPDIPSSGTSLDGAWHVAAGSVDLIGSLWTAAEGAQSIDLDGINPGTLYQDVPTVVGHSYTLAFDLAGNPGYPEPKFLLVNAGSTSQQFTFDATDQTLSDMGWTQETVSFTASAASTRIEFTSLDNASSVQGPALDAVSVTDGTSASAQPKLSAAVSAYQTALAARIQNLNFEAYTALTIDADNVAAISG